MIDRQGLPGADIHFHLLPGVDDGPLDLASAIVLARAAVADGTRTIVATPHVRSDFVTDVGSLVEATRELRPALATAGLPLDLRGGGELGHDMVGRFSQAELDTVAQGPAGARWLLVETPFEGLDDHFHAATQELRDRGFGVVLAHPERAPHVLSGDGGVLAELALGSIAQVNASSILGAHGSAAQAAAVVLARRRATVVASDAHGASRPPALRVARLALQRHGFSAERARDLTSDAPRRLLAGGMAVPARPDLVAK